MIDELIDKYSSQNICLYGLGTETERFLNEYSSKLSIVGLLDGFKADGNLYGYPIIDIADISSKDVKLIIVVARPGSCKAIAGRIGVFCYEHDIALFDVRGRDLLHVPAVSFDFNNINGASKAELMEKASVADVISFDLFDTLIMRKVMSYTDVFEILDHQLRDKGIIIPEFTKLRLFAEKKLSNNKPPRLAQIYDVVLRNAGCSLIDSAKLEKLEFELDLTLLTARESVKKVFGAVVTSGKKVVITTDSYYSKEQIIQILEKFGLCGYDDLLVSCEYGTAKTQSLFSILSKKYSNKKILHIGNDEIADTEKAKIFNIDTFRVYSAEDFYDALGGLGIENEIASISDRIKTGLILTRLFNDPFVFEAEERRVSVKDAYDIGYVFCGAMISDFILWMMKNIEIQACKHILFGARDGFLIDRLFRLVDDSKKSCYFLTSRTAAIRAGMDSQKDIDYVDSMKFFGSPEDSLRVRFGIEADDVDGMCRSAVILDKAKQQRANYKKYIDKLGIGLGKLAFFDFVAKGTTQMYLQKLFTQHIKGFYFLQLEPEFMADKGLDIEPFYSDQEKDSSAIYDNYYILETILTAPYPQIEEMDDEGNPVFAKETRSEQELRAVERAQQGVAEFFEDYLRILPGSAQTENKKLDEKFLELVNRVRILDEEFLSLKVEDPFFGRMTNIKDVIG
ncbi:hypothetical protein SAMN02910370_00683 [Lachnospiraceae bacterium XPB1003]|nr:hypothetical protein SAMN02910370_00683 [Lachnospiraceae bacterium XPB1003]